MRTALLVLAIAACGDNGSATTDSDDILDQLQALPGVTVMEQATESRARRATATSCCT